eukprot:7217287-Alexandrium_andersonii.AAC.1
MPFEAPVRKATKSPRETKWYDPRQRHPERSTYPRKMPGTAFEPNFGFSRASVSDGMKHTRAPNGITPRSQLAPNLRFHAPSPPAARVLSAWAAARAA